MFQLIVLRVIKTIAQCLYTTDLRVIIPAEAFYFNGHIVKMDQLDIN